MIYSACNVTDFYISDWNDMTISGLFNKHMHFLWNEVTLEGQFVAGYKIFTIRIVSLEKKKKKKIRQAMEF